MTDQELKELIASLAVDRKEISDLFKETDKKIAEHDRQLTKQIKELGKQIGGLGNKFGRFTEGQVFPALEKILRQRFQMEVISQRVTSSVIGLDQEIDVLAYANGTRNEVIVVEVKSLLREREFQQVQRVMDKFPQAFPEHANKRLYGIVAVVEATRDMQQRVLDEGLYLAIINDEQFEMKEPESFQPRQFNQRLAA